MCVVVDERGVVEHAQGDVAGAAGDVEDGPALLGRGGGGVGAGVEGADEAVFPEAVDAERHEVVHGVVGGGDGGEDGSDCGGGGELGCSVTGGWVADLWTLWQTRGRFRSRNAWFGHFVWRLLALGVVSMRSICRGVVKVFFGVKPLSGFSMLVLKPFLRLQREATVCC